MLTLINTNTMQPAIAPVGLDYIAGMASQAGIKTEIVDLCLVQNHETALREYFAKNKPDLIGLSFRNVDDCFWPSCQWFVPKLADLVKKIKTLTDAPIVVGGVGFSIFAKQIVEYTGADFGILGDGEQAIILLYRQLKDNKSLPRNPIIDGLINQPERLTLPTSRNAIDNTTYFKHGGQIGLETKRGCNRNCIYCADRLSKGTKNRTRNPVEVADEAQALLNQGIDVLHICDSEFNIPGSHAKAVCEEFIRRGLGKKLRWYTYMAVTPFDAELASAMRKAGCVGIDFTGDSASSAMLKTYRQPHTAQDLAKAVWLCKENGLTVMIDLLLGGPGETPETAKQTIDFIKQIEPDCAGAPLGVRIYPGTEMIDIVKKESRRAGIETPSTSLGTGNPNIKRKYDGPIDLFRPTFYISHKLGDRPARLIKDLIAGDKRFFEPIDEADAALTPSTSLGTSDHNYNDNTELVNAIAAGARGAYWHILHNLRS